MVSKRENAWGDFQPSQRLFLEAPDAPTAGSPAGRESSAAFFLELDGINCGAVESVEGGEATSDVVKAQAGADYFLSKHLARLRYEPLTLTIGLSLKKMVYDWIAAAWTAHPVRKNGAVIAADSQLTAKTRRTFTDAHISETMIPALDASSKDEALLTLKITPELVRSEKTGGKLANGSDNPKKWLASNFQLQIDGLDCTRVNSLSSFTVTRPNSAKIDFPNLGITLPESQATTWIAWHEDFVIKGNNGESQEKNGSLTFVSTDSKPICGIRFFNLGIFRLALQPPTQAGQIRHIRAELYCQRMEFRLS
jgi:phage tail-like protein